MPTDGALTAGPFNRLRRVFRNSHSEVWAWDSVNGHRVVPTVTNIDTKTRNLPMATPIFSLSKCSMHTKALKSVEIVRVSQEMDSLYKHKKHLKKHPSPPPKKKKIVPNKGNFLWHRVSTSITHCSTDRRKKLLW